MRRAELKRNVPLRSKTALRRGRGLKRSGPLPRESAKRKAERPVRAAVRAEALQRAGYRCEMAALIPEVECWGDLEVDEIKSRGVNPGGHLDVENTQVGCSQHHRWRTEHPAEARARGLRLALWESAPE